MPTDHVDLPSQLPLVFKRQEQVLDPVRSRSYLTLVVSNETNASEQPKMQTCLQIFEAAVERVKLF